jgi:DNA-binding beta-propeller fold protein YncE
MKNFVRVIIFGLLAATMLIGAAAPEVALAGQGSNASGKIVVANRASGSISVIDAAAGTLLETIDLPAGDLTPEPMYVVYSPAGNRVFVGDRANDRVVAFDADTFEYQASVPTGAGVFHMWTDPARRQLWVVGDIDKVITVINPRTLAVIATVPAPADLVALGGIPHDVILDPNHAFAFVTINGVTGDNDYVVQYSTTTFQETGRAAVGKDAHLSLSRRDNQLYVPCQTSNLVYVLNRLSMTEITRISIPGAHGAGMLRNGKVFYTTNLPGAGVEGIFAINTRTNTVIGPATDTPYAVPHNIALTPNGRMLYLTHSGATQDKVTFYSTSPTNPLPVLAGEVTVGLNPFGLAYVP